MEKLAKLKAQTNVVQTEFECLLCACFRAMMNHSEFTFEQLQIIFYTTNNIIFSNNSMKKSLFLSEISVFQ